MRKSRLSLSYVVAYFRHVKLETYPKLDFFARVGKPQVAQSRNTQFGEWRFSHLEMEPFQCDFVVQGTQVSHRRVTDYYVSLGCL